MNYTMSNLEGQKWTLKVDEEGLVEIPDDVLKELGWEIDDMLEWIDNGDGSVSLRKCD